MDTDSADSEDTEDEEQPGAKARRGAAHGERVILFGAKYDVDSGQSYPTNAVKTSKYTCLTFLPLNLFEQLQKAANIYFLLMSLLMYVGQQSSLFVSGIEAWTTASQLVLMMCASAIMAAFDDIRRHQADRKLNQQRAAAIHFAGEEIRVVHVSWEDLRVGDVLVLKSEEEVPADMVPLASSSSGGMCYVSTANLDGETNLKIKSAAPSLQSLLCSGGSPSSRNPLLDEALEKLKRVSGAVIAEAPSSKIHLFSGALELQDCYESGAGNGSGTKLVRSALTASNLLLRGTQLRNTSWCIGLVVYTGRETRLIMNSRRVPLKVANLEHVVNATMMVVLGAQALLSLFGDLLYVFSKQEFTGLWYLGQHSPPILLPDWVGYFFTFFILYSNLMPISLYATMEVCNFFQAYFIKHDLDMYDEDQDCPATVRSTNLCHELGQVSYIFSDKTGTLTQNVMELKRISVAGATFGRLQDGVRGFSGAHELEAAKRQGHAETIDAFLEVLAVSHTVMVTTDQRGEKRFEAESPDEGALVDAAGRLGWSFKGRTKDSMQVAVKRIPGDGAETDRSYSVEALCAFSSTRKRMSVVVTTPTQERLLLVKGADNVMLALAASEAPRVREHLRAFAKQGLRTLVLGRRRIDDREFAAWKAQYDAAQNTISAERREELLHAAAVRIEQRLEILGATAIEDKLQEGVAETIESIRFAGIKIWVLTGDKLETARIIGFSTKVLVEEMDIMVLDTTESTSRSEVQEELAALAPRAEKAQKKYGAALLVTGQALDEITAAGLGLDLLAVAEQCAVLIACRVSPAQKAEMVRLVRDGVPGSPVTLSIGDGANDVPMIQEAQVGVGISGKEGRQAVNAADFAIAQFRFLRPLLLVHGRWDYRRSCKFILYTFWKNAVLTLLLFYYTLMSGFSGTSLFESMVWNSFNVVLALPIIATGIFDRDVEKEQALNIPGLYVTGRLGMDLNQMKMVETMLSAVVHSLIICIVMKFAFNSLDMCLAGDYYTFGTSVYSWLIVSMNYRVAFITTTWNWAVLLAWVSSYALYVTFIIVYSQQESMDPFMYRVALRMGTTPLFWIGLVAVPALSITVDIFKAYLVLELFPDENQLVLEAGQKGLIDVDEKQDSSSGGQTIAVTPGDSSTTDPQSAPSSAVGGFAFAQAEGSSRTCVPSLYVDPKAGDTSIVDAARPMSFERQASSGSRTSRSRSLRRLVVESGAHAEEEEDDWSEAGVEEDSWEQPKPAVSGTPFAQQCLPSLQNVLTADKVAVLGAVVGTILFVLSAIVLIPSQHIVQLRLQYDGSPPGVRHDRRAGEFTYFSCPAGGNGSTKYCDVTVTVAETMPPPIRIIYILDPFYQNYNTYLKSYLWGELTGQKVAEKDRESQCIETTRVIEIGGELKQIYPCGLQATSVFNDTFEFLGLEDSIDRDINVESDFARFANPPSYPHGSAWNGTSWLYERYPTIIPMELGVRAQQFMAWMRPSALSHVAKPWGNLNAELKKGENLTVRIGASFPSATSIPSSKALLLTTYTRLGGRNDALAILLAASGGLCYIIAASTWIMEATCAREKGKRRFGAGGDDCRRTGCALCLPLPARGHEGEDDDEDESDEEPPDISP